MTVNSIMMEYEESGGNIMVDGKLKANVSENQGPTWNPDEGTYEFESGTKVYAYTGSIGLEPNSMTLSGVNEDYEVDIVGVNANLTNADKIALADMMIQRWQFYRNTCRGGK